MGVLSDGSDSRAEVIEPASHWSNMHALILIAGDGRKKVNGISNFLNARIAGLKFKELSFNIIIAGSKYGWNASQR